MLVPHANLTLRRVPEGMSDGVALFAGDVMGTGYHAIAEAGFEPGDVVAVLGLGPVGLCAVQVARAAGAAGVIAIDSVADWLRAAESFGAQAVHLRGRPPGRGQARHAGAASTWPSTPSATPTLELACRYPQGWGGLGDRRLRRAIQVHMGIVWIKALTLRTGHANVIGHVDRVLAMMAAGVLDPTPLVSREMPLAEAPEAYAAYDRREALKIVMRP